MPVIVPSDILKFHPEPFLAILILHNLQSSSSFSALCPYCSSSIARVYVYFSVVQSGLVCSCGARPVGRGVHQRMGRPEPISSRNPLRLITQVEHERNQNKQSWQWLCNLTVLFSPISPRPNCHSVSQFSPVCGQEGECCPNCIQASVGTSQ